MQLRLTLKAVTKRKPEFSSGFLFAVAFVASLTAMLFCNQRFKHEIHIVNISVNTHEFHDFLMPCVMAKQLSVRSVLGSFGVSLVCYTAVFSVVTQCSSPQRRVA